MVALRPGLALDCVWGPIHTGDYMIAQNQADYWTVGVCLYAGQGAQARRQSNARPTGTRRNVDRYLFTGG